MRISKRGEAPQAVTISRRVLLGGLVGSSAAGLLLNVSPAQAQVSGPIAGNAEDVLWLLGSVDSAIGYTLQGIDPSGKEVAKFDGISYAVARSANGQLIAEADFKTGAKTKLRTFDCLTGKIRTATDGNVVWPAVPDATVAFADSDQTIVVAGTYLLSANTGEEVIKTAPDGSPFVVTLKSWTAETADEFIDARTGSVRAGHAGLGAVVGETTQLKSGRGGHVLKVRTGPTGATISRFAGATLSFSASIEEPNVQEPRLVDEAGAAIFLSPGGDLQVLDTAGRQIRIPLNLQRSEAATAKPFAPAVVDAGNGQVIVLDAARRIILRADYHTGAIVKQRQLSNSETFAVGYSRQQAGVALDRDRNRLYFADPSGVSGGVWVHDATTLEVVDRFHSDAQFGLVWVAPVSGTIFMQSADGPVAIHSSDGRLVAVADSNLQTAIAL